MSPEAMLGQLLLLAVLILLSGFFSSSETALFSISRVRATHLAKVGGRRDKLIKEMKEDPHRLLSTILIGNNLVNIAASSLATAFTINLAANHAVGIATGVMTFLILVFGEIFPKSIATRNNVLIARLVIVPIHWLSVLFLPFVLFLNFIPRLVGMTGHKLGLTEQELLTYVEMTEEEGQIDKQEKEFIENVLTLDHTGISAVMTPRTEMFVIDVDQPLDFDRIMESGFTRIPVIERDIDNVVGILNIKNLYAVRSGDCAAVNVRDIMQEPFFVPEKMTLDALLRTFKKRKQHMAIVVDEYGGVSGLVTLEDTLEKIVGEIIDETDKHEPSIVPIRENEWIVRGRSAVHEVNKIIPMEIPDSNEYDTFSGYVLHTLQRIPRLNEQLRIGEFLVTVKEADGPQIRLYGVRHET